MWHHHCCARPSIHVTFATEPFSESLVVPCLNSPIQETDEAVTLGLLIPLFANDPSLRERGVLPERSRQIIIRHFVAQISDEEPVIIWRGWKGFEAGSRAITRGEDGRNERGTGIALRLDKCHARGLKHCNTTRTLVHATSR